MMVFTTQGTLAQNALGTMPFRECVDQELPEHRRDFSLWLAVPPTSEVARRVLEEGLGQELFKARRYQPYASFLVINTGLLRRLARRRLPIVGVVEGQLALDYALSTGRFEVEA
jgi:hypothetical protein